jgi:hypothetical protein
LLRSSSGRPWLCAACIKTCPYGSIQLIARAPTKELWFIRKPKLEESFLAVVIMGIVFVQNITMLEVWQSLLAGLQRLTGTTSYLVNFTVTFLIAMVIPISLLAGAAWLGRRLNNDSFAGNFAKFGYAIIPLDMAGHIAHNLFHLLAEGKAVAFTGLELFGTSVSDTSTAFVSAPTTQLLQYGLIALGAAASLYVVYRIARHQYAPGQIWRTFTPYAAVVVVFSLINVWLFALPMGMRM